MPPQAYVHILASTFQVLYIGVTTNLSLQWGQPTDRYIAQHRDDHPPA